MIGAHFSDRYGARGFVTAFAGVVATVGFGMFFGSSSLHVKYASLFLSISGAYNISPTVSTWAANNFAPYTRRATSIALGIGLSNCGGIVATWLFGTISPPPEFRTATITLLVSSVVIVLVTGMNNGYLYWHNKRKEERRKAIGRREDEERGLGDRSAWFVYSL
ncbi:hypothetical protein H0H87_001735 [Tephrocybe sp. NHM501043]|nr:hypothetical protein H0H87_001735 [Tephrocybe sp. NHM501043]